MSQLATKPGRKTKKYQVVAGQHIQDDPLGRKNPDGSTVQILYPTGSIVETPLDLERLNQYDPQTGQIVSEKFRRIHEDQAAAGLPSTATVWDSAKETLEEFVARQRATGASPGSSAAAPSASSATTPPLPSAEPVVLPPNAVPPGVKATEEMKTLSMMTVNELRKLAEEQEVDLKGAKSKEDILKVFAAFYGA